MVRTARSLAVILSVPETVIRCLSPLSLSDCALRLSIPLSAALPSSKILPPAVISLSPCLVQPLLWTVFRTCLPFKSHLYQGEIKCMRGRASPSLQMSSMPLSPASLQVSQISLAVRARKKLSKTNDGRHLWYYTHPSSAPSPIPRHIPLRNMSTESHERSCQEKAVGACRRSVGGERVLVEKCVLLCAELMREKI